MSMPFVRFVCRVLVVCMIGLPLQAFAEIIGTDKIVSAAGAQTERATLVSFVSRTELARQLQAFGLSQKAAQERVAALTDEDIAKLAGQIETLPAGAHSVEILLLIAIALFLWWTIEKTSR